MTNTLIASKIYRPETVSIAGQPTPTDQDTLRRWWQWGVETKYFGNSDADNLRSRAAMRAGQFTVRAKARNGYYLLEAFA